jgi:hypothetical protein
MLIRFVPFLAALPAVASLPAAGQGVGSIPSRLIKAVEFEDRGRVYRVDLESGKVIFSESADIVPIPPAPVPPAPPKPNPPVPTPALTGLALRVNETFRAKVTTNTAQTAADLARAIDVTLAVTGGTQLKGQQILDELRTQVEWKGLIHRLNGFPLGDMLAVVIGDDETKIVSALRDAKAGLEAIK